MLGRIGAMVVVGAALSVALLSAAHGGVGGRVGPVLVAAPVLRHGIYTVRRGREDRVGAVVAVQSSRPLVALSFDDGPDPRWTPPILRALRQARAHATFFAIGERVIADTALARQTVRLGNEVEDHTFSHPVLTRLGSAAVRREVRLGHRALLRAGLPRPRFFRPPHGAFDRRVIAAARAVGERVIGWDVPLDRDLRGRSIREAVSRTARRVRRGSIILAHDGGTGIRARTVRAVPLLLRALRRRGLRVVSVGELLASRADSEGGR